MEKFIERHADKIIGTLSCFDRVLFRGYLPIMSDFGASDVMTFLGRKLTGHFLGEVVTTSTSSFTASEYQAGESNIG